MLSVFQELNVAPMWLISCLAKKKGLLYSFILNNEKNNGNYKTNGQRALFPSLSSVLSFRHYTAIKKHIRNGGVQETHHLALV